MRAPFLDEVAGVRRRLGRLAARPVGERSASPPQAPSVRRSPPHTSIFRVLRGAGVPLVLALGVAILSAAGLFAIPNGVVFDTITESDVFRSQPVVIVRTNHAERGEVVAHLSAARVRTIAEDSELAQPATTFGIERAFVGHDGRLRLIRLPADVRAPEFSGAQVLRIPAVTLLLRGRIVILGRPVADGDARFTPSVYASPRILDGTQFRARIVQAIASGRTAAELGGSGRSIVIVFFGLLLVSLHLLIGRRLRTKTSIAALMATWLVGLAALLAGVMLPLSELTLLLTAAPIATKAMSWRDREMRLRSLADRAATFMRSNTLVGDGRRWIAFLPAMLRLAGADSSVILEYRGLDGWTPLDGQSPETLIGRAITRAQALAADRAYPHPVQVSNSADGKRLYLARIDRPDYPTYCLFEIAPSADPQGALAYTYRVFDHLARLARPDVRSPAAADYDAQLLTAMNRLASFAGELRRTIGALHTATMLFDGSGVPLQLNRAMRTLLARANVIADEATPLDVAIALSGLEENMALDLLAQALRHGGSLSLSSRHEIEGRFYDSRVTRSGGGLLFEAADVTELQHLARLRTEVASEIDARIRNDLEAIEVATKLAGDSRLADDRRARAMQMVSQAAGRTRDTLESLSQMISSAAPADQSEPFAVNPRTALIKAVTAVRAQAGASLPTLNVVLPELASLVLADPDDLDELLQAMLQIVMADAPEGGEIEVALNEGEQSSMITISGGFGLPRDRFVLALGDAAVGVPPPFRALQRASATLPSWHAELAASSDAGTGYRFALTLQRATA